MADNALIARRLLSIRETLAYSLADVANASSIRAERLSAIEGGAEATGDEILVLASVYDCDFRRLVDAQLPAPDARTDTLFRRFGASFNERDKRAVQEFVYLCQVEHELERALHVPKQNFEARIQGTFFKDHAVQAASELRRLFGHKPNEVPRDVYADFRNLGVHIFRRRLDNDEISGLFLKDAVAGNCVLVNYSEDVYRQRFSAAHEIAHVLFDGDQEASLTYVPQSSKYDRRDLVEIRANTFAAHYLMPPSVISQLPPIRTQKDAVRWAHDLRVSTAALANALAEVQRTHEAELTRTAKVPISVKIDPEAPDSLTDRQRERRIYLLEHGLSDYFTQLCFRAHDRDVVTTARLAELLRVGRSELADVARLFNVTL